MKKEPVSTLKCCVNKLYKFGRSVAEDLEMVSNPIIVFYGLDKMVMVNIDVTPLANIL